MNVPKTIPEQLNANHEVDKIVIDLNEKMAYMHIKRPDGSIFTGSTDIIQLFTTYSVTAQQKTIIKSFLKYIIAEVVAIPEGTITEELLPES